MLVVRGSFNSFDSHVPDKSGSGVEADAILIPRFVLVPIVFEHLEGTRTGIRSSFTRAEILRCVRSFMIFALVDVFCYNKKLTDTC